MSANHSTMRSALRKRTLGSGPSAIDPFDALQFARKKRSTAKVFELRYGDFLDTDVADWQFGEQVLDQDEAQRIPNNGR